MKKRVLAVVLAMASVFAFGSNAVRAEDDVEEQAAIAAEDAAAATAQESGGTAEETAAAPDAESVLSFYNVEQRMHENYYPLLALEENAKIIEEIDYDKLERDLRNGMSAIVDRQWQSISESAAGVEALSSSPVPGLSALAPIAGIGGTMTASALQPTYDSMREQYDSLKDGTMLEDNEGALRQIRNMQNQAVMLGESAYIQLIAAQEKDAALSRSIASLDRQIRAAEVSQGNGLVSELAVQQAKNGRAQYASGQQTLRMNVNNGFLQLKVMIGMEQSEPLTLAALPKVTSEQLAAMALEDDLASAKEASYELYAAERELKDAKETYEDAEEDYGGDAARKDAFVRAGHTWQSAQYTYENTVQSYELKFRTLYTQVKDCAQKLDAAKSALAQEEKNYAVSALKCKQGTISENALADAADTLSNAKDALSTAERDLLSTYRSYYWAVEHGILN